jgi:uncharacterized protein (DUF3084 family)
MEKEQQLEERATKLVTQEVEQENAEDKLAHLKSEIAKHEGYLQSLSEYRCRLWHVRPSTLSIVFLFS